MAATSKPSVLIATRELSYDVLAPMLASGATLIHAATVEDALRVLRAHAAIELVVTTVAFDESRMFKLLRTLKSRYAAMPFIVCRAPDTDLNEVSLEAVRIASQALGAAAFVDLRDLLARLGDRGLQDEVRAVVFQHLAHRL